MKRFLATVLWLVLVFLPQPVLSEVGQSLTFRLVHPQNVDLVKNRQSPKDHEKWELYSSGFKEGTKKYWVEKQSVLNQRHIREVWHELSKPPSEAFIQKYLEANPGILDRNPGLDDQMRKPVGDSCIILELDAEGTRKWERVTTLHQRKRIAIVFNEKILSAPVINEPISSSKMQICGYDLKEAQKIVDEMKIVLEYHAS